MTRYGGFFHTSVTSPRRLSYENRRPSTASIFFAQAQKSCINRSVRRDKAIELTKMKFIYFLAFPLGDPIKNKHRKT